MPRCCSLDTIRYIGATSLSLAQCVLDTTNGWLWFENIIMYKLGFSSYSAMFISPRSKKRKMATGSGFVEVALEELAGVLLCRTGGARGCPAGA